MCSCEELSIKIWHTPTRTNQNWTEFQKFQLIPYKSRYSLAHSPPSQEVCPQTYSLSLPLEWSQVTHILTRIKMGGAYKPEKEAFYSSFARQLCDGTRFPGWLSAFQHTHKHSNPLQQTLPTQIANHHIQWARNLSSVFLFFTLYLHCVERE